ncbi:DEAD/DEAH box helicase [Cetobacterium sp.]|uniref:DEAD/DEAH box helicase n=1 Tax=Cetobacterium sp. TaxID=2071632 RepID=UPI003F3BA776
MKLIRDNYLKIIPANNYEKEIINQLLEKRCITPNPEYAKMIATGFWSPVKKDITTFKYYEESNTFYINKYNYPVYLELLELGLPLEEIIDKRTVNEIEVTALYGPRDKEQENSIFALLQSFESFGGGILEACPSSGKTIIACILMGKLKQRTLILVDMNLLVEQFVDSILVATDIKEHEIGFIIGDTVDYKDKKVIIATNQSLAKKPEVLNELAKVIGFVVQDECQIASCDTVQKAFRRLKPRYQLGLSGTPYRDDNMDFLIREIIGPIVYKADREAMVKAGSMLTPILRPIFLYDKEKVEKYKNSEADFREVVEEFYNCPKAIDKITNLVLKHMEKGDTQLLICKEKTMIDNYYEALVKKICGNDIFEKAKKEIETNIEQLELERELTMTKDVIEFFGVRDKKKYETERTGRKALKLKYEKKREEELRKLDRRIKLAKNKKIIDTNTIKNNEAIKQVCVMTGEIGKTERNRIIEEANAGKIKVIIVSSVFDKGVSVNRINVLYLLFSTRERNNTTQRVGRCIRAFPGKKYAIVYDIIYSHYMSLAQFSNKKGDCRLTAHNGYTDIPKSINLFLWWVSSVIKDNHIPEHKKQEFMEQYYKKYVIEV